jgi:hypothetical protein
MAHRRNVDGAGMESHHLSTKHNTADVRNSHEVYLCLLNYVKYRTRINSQILAPSFIWN